MSNDWRNEEKKKKRLSLHLDFTNNYITGMHIHFMY